MKIKVEKNIIEYNVAYKIIEIEKCCDKLINSKNISLNSHCDDYNCYYDEGDEDNEDDEVYDDYSVKLVRVETISDYYCSTEDNYYYEKILFCPFCGEKIIIEIVNTIDKTEEYKALCKERDNLWNKCCKTDSKKKESELRNQVNELDRKINSMLQSDDFFVA